MEKEREMVREKERDGHEENVIVKEKERERKSILLSIFLSIYLFK